MCMSQIQGILGSGFFFTEGMLLGRTVEHMNRIFIFFGSDGYTLPLSYLKSLYK
jgi:hypothetical protein